ncbi:MAG: helix-turn-helix transcriptional regulator [Anaerovoracaceae bacterium]
MNAKFIQERISQLRIQKGVSEYQMSYDLGHSRGYIYNISSGKSLPPLLEFLSICDYFNITPQEFFDTKIENPRLVSKGIDLIKKLNEDDLKIVIDLMERLCNKK